MGRALFSSDYFSLNCENVPWIPSYCVASKFYWDVLSSAEEDWWSPLMPSLQSFQRTHHLCLTVCSQWLSSITWAVISLTLGRSICFSLCPGYLIFISPESYSVHLAGGMSSIKVSQDWLCHHSLESRTRMRSPDLVDGLSAVQGVFSLNDLIPPYDLVSEF